MKNVILFILIWIGCHAFAQELKVPESIYFAGLKLEFNKQVQRKLQTEVDNIRRNRTYFQNKVDRADLYFPIIEKVFEEEGFPKDFKFLALQESSLVSDAVSSSNAVGYWQFKKASAEEVGLRCDHFVDERMNIVSASRGAAKYLKRNNAVLKNWVYALLSYNLGLGGVKREVDEKYVGASSMKITDRMHWYVVRFLAHKIAYENEVGRNSKPDMYLVEYPDCSFKSFRDIAKETSLDQDEIEDYNKWMRKGRVPNDKKYVVILPVKASDYSRVLALTGSSQNSILVSNTNTSHTESRTESTTPEKITSTTNKNQSNAPVHTHNKLRAIKARPGDSFADLARMGDIHLSNLIMFNEVNRVQQPIPGMYYYLQPKRSRALISEHVTQPGQTLWEIAQIHGIRSNSIRKKNRMSLREEPIEGRVLQLRKKRKRKEKIEYVKIPKKEEQVSPPPAKKDVEEKVIVSKQDKEINSRPPEQPEVKKEEKLEKEPEIVVISKEADSLESNINSTEISYEAKKEIYHLVLQGETLYGLSRKYQVSLDSLNSWNDLPNGLKTGQNIVVGYTQNTGNVSNPGPAIEKVIMHEVQAGETMYRISRKYGNTVEQIMKWNNKSDYSVSTGELLKIIID